MSDPVVWTRSAVRRELQHLVCCSPSSRPCNLRFPERANVPGRSTNTDWAAFQIAAHARADVVTAIAELWPETAGLDWEHVAPAQLRALPAPVQALWVVVIRGPNDAARPHVPAGQRTASRFGFVPWKAASRILRRDRKTIQLEIAAAVDLIVAWLSPWPLLPAERSTSWRGVHCAPGRHEFSVSGNSPAAGMRCLCGRIAFRP